MNLNQATEIAERIRAELAPFCERIEIAGSIRRRKPEVGDIEIVCIPMTWETGLLFGVDIVRDPGFIQSVRGVGAILKGDLCHGRYIKLRAPEDIQVDLFLARPENWGLIYAIRTGSADYSHHVLASAWCRAGFHSMDGMLVKGFHKIAVREERDLFNLIGLAWSDPWERNL